MCVCVCEGTFGSVPCACVLVSPLYYKPSVKVFSFLYSRSRCAPWFCWPSLTAAERSYLSERRSTRAAHSRSAERLCASAAWKHKQSINQSKVLTKPHTGKGEATSQHHHRGQQTLHHEVMQAWGAVNESRQHWSAKLVGTQTEKKIFQGEEALDTGGGRVFSLDASFGLLATARASAPALYLGSALCCCGVKMYKKTKSEPTERLASTHTHTRALNTSSTRLHITLTQRPRRKDSDGTVGNRDITAGMWQVEQSLGTCSKGFALTWYRALSWYSSPARPFAASDVPLRVTGQQGSLSPACRQLSKARNASAESSREESTKLGHGAKLGRTLC